MIPICHAKEKGGKLEKGGKNVKGSFEDAVIFAATKHAGQKRKNGEPYFYHLIKTAELVKQAGFGTDYQIAALLHDTLEDTDTQKEELEVFGKDVVKAVYLVTRKKGQKESDYVEGILSDHMASVVKNADKINNLYDAAHCGDIVFAKRYAETARQYYRERFSEGLDNMIELIRMAEERVPGVLDRPLALKKEQLQLYTDRINERKKSLIECAEKVKDSPYRKPCVFYQIDGEEEFYCVVKGTEETYILTAAGWVQVDPVFWPDYEGDADWWENINKTKEKIRSLGNAGWFYPETDWKKM